VRRHHLALRLVLALAGLTPLLYGLAAMIDGHWLAAISRVLSSAAISMTPELEYARKPLGLYVAMSGALLLYAIADPVRHRTIITWGALLLLARGVQRGLLTRELHQIFAIPLALNLLHAAYLVGLALTLLALRARLSSAAGASDQTVPAAV
jgi:hypothetical protein